MKVKSGEKCEAIKKKLISVIQACDWGLIDLYPGQTNNEQGSDDDAVLLFSQVNVGVVEDEVGSVGDLTTTESLEDDEKYGSFDDDTTKQHLKEEVCKIVKHLFPEKPKSIDKESLDITKQLFLDLVGIYMNDEGKSHQELTKNLKNITEVDVEKLKDSGGLHCYAIGGDNLLVFHMSAHLGCSQIREMH